MPLPKTPPCFFTAIVSSAQTRSPPECMNERMHVCSIVFNSFAIPWTVAHQAPLSMGFSKQAYWSELPFPTPGDLTIPGNEPMSLASPAQAGEFFTTSATWEAHCLRLYTYFSVCRGCLGAGHGPESLRTLERKNKETLSVVKTIHIQITFKQPAFGKQKGAGIRALKFQPWLCCKHPVQDTKLFQISIFLACPMETKIWTSHITRLF